MSRALLFAALVSLAASSRAHADEAKVSAADKAKAKALYDEGLRHYNVAEYADAIRVWKQAYLLTKRSLLLFNIGQAYRLSGDCEQAMTFYASYRREETKPDSDLDDAEKICKAKLEEQKVKQSPPPTPTPTTTLTTTRVAPPPARSDKTTGMRKAGIVIGLAGVVLAGGAVYFAVDSASKHDELDDYRGEWNATQVELDADGKRSEKLAWGLGLGALAAVGTGVALFVLGAPSHESPGVAVVPTRSGAQVEWSFTF